MVVVVSAPPEVYGDVAVLRVTSFTDDQGNHRTTQQALPSLSRRRRYHLPLGHTPQTEFANPILAPLITSNPSTFGCPSYLYVAQAYNVPFSSLQRLAADRVGPTRLTLKELERARHLLFAILSGKVPLQVATRALAPRPLLPPPSPPGPSNGASRQDVTQDAVSAGGAQQLLSAAARSWASVVGGAARDDEDFRALAEKSDLESIRYATETEANNIRDYDRQIADEVARGEEMFGAVGDIEDFIEQTLGSTIDHEPSDDEYEEPAGDFRVFGAISSN